jgi:hypothetical protein
VRGRARSRIVGAEPFADDLRYGHAGEIRRTVDGGHDEERRQNLLSGTRGGRHSGLLETEMHPFGAERDRREHEAHRGEHGTFGLRHDEQPCRDDRGDEKAGDEQSCAEIARDERRQLVAVVGDVVDAEHVEPEVGQASDVGHHGESEHDHAVRIGSQSSSEIRGRAEPDDASQRLAATKLYEAFRDPCVSSQKGCSSARPRPPAALRPGRSR